MIETFFYIRKPLVVEAVQVTEENLYEVAQWCGGDVKTLQGERIIEVSVLHPSTKAQTIARPGMWVLRSDQGYKIFNDRAFTRGFDKATGAGDLPNEVRQALKKMGAKY